MAKTVEGMMLGILQRGLFGGGKQRAPRIKPPRTELDELRSRWHKWLGQVCRIDREGWVDLLGGDYTMWLARVMKGDYQVLRIDSTRFEVWEAYSKGIAQANGEELRALDMLYCEKPRRKPKRSKRIGKQYC